MEMLYQTLGQTLSNPDFQILLAVVIIAGVARGFSGFGTGMIVAPVTAAIYSPQVALVFLAVMDSWPSAFPAIRARKLVNWSEIRPILLGFVIALPLGIAFVKYYDPILLRWFISGIIFISVILLWSGWQYRGPRNFATSSFIGTMCGFLSGSTQIPGPPAIIYWMATRTGAGIVRANILMLFLVTEYISLGGFYLSWLFTRDAAIKGLLASPFYLIGIIIGTGMFGLASEQTYRRFTFILILASATFSLPVLKIFS